MKKLIYIAIIVFLLLAYKESQAYTPDQWVELYQRDCKEVSEIMVCKQKLEESLSRAFSNRLMILYYLKKHDIPSWIATIPVIESEYKIGAISKSGAVGLWQFMPATAKEFGLTDRSNPVESTKAACLYLNSLHEKYNNWELALMAYNAGEPRIDNFLNKKGKPLKFETLNYYPQIMALQRIIEDITTGSNFYGFSPKPTKTHFKRYLVYTMFLK